MLTSRREVRPILEFPLLCSVIEVTDAFAGTLVLELFGCVDFAGLSSICAIVSVYLRVLCMRLFLDAEGGRCGEGG